MRSTIDSAPSSSIAHSSPSAAHNRDLLVARTPGRSQLLRARGVDHDRDVRADPGRPALRAEGDPGTHRNRLVRARRRERLILGAWPRARLRRLKPIDDTAATVTTATLRRRLTSQPPNRRPAYLPRPPPPQPFPFSHSFAVLAGPKSRIDHPILMSRTSGCRPMAAPCSLARGHLRPSRDLRITSLASFETSAARVYEVK